MGLDVFKIGDKIEITDIEKGLHAKTADTGAHIPSYVSQIYEVVDDDRLKIEMPLSGTTMVVLQVNYWYDLCIYTSNGLYQCTVQVVDRFKSENRHIALVEVKGGLHKIQRREYYRMERLFAIEYRVLDDSEKDFETVEEIIENESLSVVYNEAIAVDISGGGSRLIMKERFSNGAYVLMKIRLGVNRRPVNLIGEVVFSQQMKMDKTQFETRLRFVKMQETERETLIKRIFEEERKKRQKERVELK